MHIKLIKDFINAYEKEYKQEFQNDFKGELERIKMRFYEPFLHASASFLTRLNSIIASLEKPINVAILGQFSSGKSSLLNLILQKEILPTGAVPVTFKPTFLRYAKEYLLKVEFENGFEKLCELSELGFYTDQRKELQAVKSLTLFAPIPLLEKLTLVDMPGLNANATDDKSAFSELENIHSVIWLSLIDNAGKKSEEDAIISHLELLKDTQSLCVLNQKDKLDQVELERILNYATEVFGKYFNNAIIPLSCKEAKSKQSYERSNFNALLKHLQSLDTQKLHKNFIKTRLLKLCEILLSQYLLFENILEKLVNIFKTYEDFLTQNESIIKQKIDLLSLEVLTHLKALSEKIAQEIEANIKEKQAYFYTPSTSFLHKNLYQKHEYKAPAIASDEVFLNLFYHSDKLNKEFKKMKTQILKEFEGLKLDLEGIFSHLEQKIILFKSEFLHIQKDEILQSEVDFSELRAFVGASDELFLKDFKQALFEESLKLDLFFEKLSIKALTNYESASKLTLSFFSRKINESREFFELDSTEFHLYHPEYHEIYERMLTELNFYEFEALLIDKPFIVKKYQDLNSAFKALILQKFAIINKYKSQIEKQKQWVLKTKALIKDL
ncbi:ATP-binding protein [Campylobacter sp. MIT 19-121]|uniref:dynamin family protein n=1 Tax=Campylobacter sp. MIT 19-121 TaxID=2703906 RepID=UPI001389A535|nr:dynamin family protein [Campylobacter sp. MIT 19-121]NDJ26513.1 ATP-binding protein [Campylobacter sp. MIT 19-121]